MSYVEWIQAKKEEKAAQAKRRRIEDKLIRDLEIDSEKEGVFSTKEEGFDVKISPKLVRKVSSTALEEIMQDEGLYDVAKVLFRWKPELDLSAWRKAPQELTEKFLDAITTKAARPTFSIKEIEE